MEQGKLIQLIILENYKDPGWGQRLIASFPVFHSLFLVCLDLARLDYSALSKYAFRNSCLFVFRKGL